MRIFEPAVREGYEWVVPTRDSDFEVLADLSGRRLGEHWTPVPIRLITTDEDGRPRKRSDFPCLGSHLIVMSEEACRVLGPLLQRDAELLPLACDERRLWVLNVCTIVDALDLGKSEVEFFDTGRIMDLRKPVFLSERLNGIDAFKLTNDRRGSTYLSGRVVQAIEAAPLVGYGFRLVWTDEAPESTSAVKSSPSEK